MRKSFIVPLVGLAVFLSGCADGTSPSGGASPVVEAATEAAADAPQSGPMATALALGQSVTLVAPTPTASLDDVGYRGVVERACTIVDENYVRGDFNGVDWQAVCEEYLSRVEGVDNDQDLYDLLDRMIGELGDQHSRFVSPDEFAREFNLPRPGEGAPTTGIEIWPGPAREWQNLHIWNVCQQGAAAAAGIRRGDILLEVNGQPVGSGVTGFDPALWSQAIVGDGETDQVQLTILQGPDSEPATVSVELGGVAGCDGWRYQLITESPRVGYLRIPNFAGDSAANIMDAIEELEAAGPLEGLILDVRHNPGGNSDEAIGVFTTGVFGKIGPLREDQTQTIYRIRGPVAWNETTPVALLTDGASHSAAEYFATAMKQSGRATVVGMPTAGNTEGITGFNLPGGSLVRLAVLTLQLPDGGTLEGVGVIPDREVPVGMWGLRQQPDVQLQAAYEIITGSLEPE